jgi:CHASE3 domain sensor protein
LNVNSSTSKAGFLGNLKIGTKLTIGLGILALLTLLVVALSYLGSARATEKINTTAEIRAPTALTSARAQAELLGMLGDVRGYLALGELPYRTSYGESYDSFTKELATLKSLATVDTDTQELLRKLDIATGQWSQLPEKMFELRDNQLEREPAYKLLMTDGQQFGGAVLIGVNALIETQGQVEPSMANSQHLVAMAKFQGSFATMMTNLHGYVTTRNPEFRSEYEANLIANNSDWDALVALRDSLTPSQQAMLDDIAENREAFEAVVDNLLVRLEGPDWRLDLFWFKTVAVPRADAMLSLLGEITDDQQDLLQQDLNEGKTGLSRARMQTLIGGGIALITGLALALILGRNIAGPVRRLTRVAERIETGDLQAQADVESRDEIGILAGTFNNMTGQLRETLTQVSKEKKRADDLLEVVIPIGVTLASEKDFNRLLENMLLEAKSFCHSDGGTVYLRTDDDKLEFVIVRNDGLRIAMGGTTGEPIPFAPVPLRDPSTGEPNDCSLAARAALTGTSVNVANTADLAQFQMCVVEEQAITTDDDFGAISVLAIPLKGNQGDVLGVLELFNAKDPDSDQIIPFDATLQRMMESYSSLAVAALDAYIREQELYQEIQELRIEIDETKQQKQISEIVETDFFQDLQKKARGVRGRRAPQVPAENSK